MKFTCLPIHNMVVVIEPGKTKFFGPGQFQHEEGVEAKFNNGFLVLDEFKPKSFELIKKLIRHPQFGSDFKYVQESSPGFTSDGRPAMVVGFTLAEAIGHAERYFIEMEVNKKSSTASDLLEFESIPVIQSESLKDIGPIGPTINTGAVTSADIQPKAKKIGVPRSKFVKVPEVVESA